MSHLMVTVSIDGEIVHLERQTTILKAAEKLGIHIPHLCYHESLKPYGACRLCLVEIIKNRRSQLVTSCNYPVENGLEVLTNSERVRRARKMVVELLLARCPDVPLVRQLATEMGIETARFKKMEGQRCILCGLCVRVCEEMVGVSAIGFVNRGTEREVNTPFASNSDVCIGCGACTYLCPTGCIEMKPAASDGRSLHMGDIPADTCPNNYQCETCEIEHKFLGEMKEIIKVVRAGK